MPRVSVRDLQRFLAKHHVVHLASSGTGGAHSAPVFYALVDGGPSLVWISDPKVLHSVQISEVSQMALSIAPSGPPLTSVVGVQMRGVATSSDDEQPHLKTVYLKRFPAARAMVLAKPGHRFYRFDPSWARLVKQRLGIDRGGELDLDLPAI